MGDCGWVRKSWSRPCRNLASVSGPVMRYRSPTRRRQSTRSRYAFASASVNGLLGGDEVVAGLGRQQRERLVHVVVGGVGDHERVAAGVRTEGCGFGCRL